MALRQTSGSVVCPGCGRLVGVGDEQCWHCGRRNPGLWGFAKVFQGLGDEEGLAKLVIGVCGILYALMLVTDPSGIGGSGLLTFLSPSFTNSFLFGSSGYVPVVNFDRWWTVLSATWLHGSLLHVGFNMMWAYQLLPPVARLYGVGRAVIIYLGAGITGFLATSLVIFVPILPRLPFLQPAGYTLGASGAILGLLGALVYYGRRTGSSMVGRQAMSSALFLIIFGFVMPGIDNWAHLGGFGGGYLIARWLDPLKNERADHVIVAIVILVLSLLSIVASVLHGLPLL